MKKNIFKDTKTLLYCLILLILISTGGFLRFSNLTTSPYWMDEGYTINAVLSYQEHGTGLLDSGNKYNCPVYCGITAQIANQLGDNPTSYRLLAALAGVLFLPIIFLIIRDLFRNNTIALLTTFFTTFSYMHIAWSHQARWYTLFTLFFWITLWSFYKLITTVTSLPTQQILRIKNIYQNKKILFYATITLITFIIARYSHSLSLVLLPLFSLWAVVNLQILFTTQKIILSKNYLLWIKILSVFLPLLILLHPFFINQITNITLSNHVLDYTLYILTHYSFFLLFSIPAYWLGWRKHKKILIYFSIALLSYLIPLFFLTTRIEYRYIFHLTPLLFILSSLGIVLLTKKYTHLYQRMVLFTLVILLYLLFGDKSFAPQKQYFLESDNIDGTIPHLLTKSWASYTPQPNWTSAYSFISTRKKNGDLIISSHPHFNKIFLQEAGYWLKHNYVTHNKLPKDFIQNDREHYVNAKVIDDKLELQKIMKNNHGYIVLDASSQSNRIAKDILKYLKDNSQEVFYEYTNHFSKIWVYKF